MRREDVVGPEMPRRYPVREILDVYDLRANYLLTEEEASRLATILAKFGPFTIVGKRLEFSGGGEVEFFSVYPEER